MNSSLFIPPTSHFRRAVRAMWQIDRSVPFHKECILTKGVVEIIFNLNGSLPLFAQLGGRQYCISNGFINDFNTRPIHLQLPEQRRAATLFSWLERTLPEPEQAIDRTTIEQLLENANWAPTHMLTDLGT